ncbi:MAG: TIGR00725 family protein [Halobacteriales archaeon]|nr:TIGR00725 family protein [Halobacteriales archaeon]
MRVSVIGGSQVTDAEYRLAERLGEQLADRGHSVICGGLTGVMEAVCKGVKQQGGRTIGILPGERRSAANDYVDTAIATGLGNARNALVVLNGAGTIAVDGSTGTLSEIGHALDYGRPVAGLKTHDIDGVEPFESPAAAIEYIETEAGGGDG